MRTFIYGVMIGIANILPTISGSTIAVIFNIYDKILYAISFKNIRANLSFLIPLGLGALVGAYAFSKFLMILIFKYDTIVELCFIALIIAGIPSIYKRAKFEKVKARNIAFLVAAFAFMCILTFLGNGNLSNKTLEQMGGMNPSIFIWLILVTAISTVAMLLPGVSGSFVMLLLGAYTVVLEALASLDFFVLLPIMLGALLGLFIGLKVIKKMLRFHPQAFYFAVLGLIIGSILMILSSYFV